MAQAEGITGENSVVKIYWTNPANNREEELIKLGENLKSMSRLPVERQQTMSQLGAPTDLNRFISGGTNITMEGYIVDNSIEKFDQACVNTEIEGIARPQVRIVLLTEFINGTPETIMTYFNGELSRPSIDTPEREGFQMFSMSGTFAESDLIT